MLGYEDLRKAVEQGRLLFDPSIDPDMQIGLSSIDLRLGYGRGEIKKSTGETIQPADPAFEIGKYIIDTTLGPGQPLIIQPRQFLLATVYEEVSLPNDLGAYVWGKSTIARFGLSVHATAPLIHPTWVGHITLELYNNGTRPLMFTPGRDPICQLTFHEIETPIPAEVARSLGSFMKQTVPSGSQ